ncbi:MAG: hypothetical protein ACLFN0_10545 [Thermovirgaceae bacterium]
MNETEVCVILRKRRPGQLKIRRNPKEPLLGKLFDGNMSALFPRMRQRVNLKDILN